MGLDCSEIGIEQPLPRTSYCDSSSRQQQFKNLSLPNKLPRSVFKNNRSHFLETWAKFSDSNHEKQNSLAFFKGASATPLHRSSDCNYPEHQESFFQYLFGVTETGCYAILELDTQKTVLFVPRQDEFFKIWMSVPDPSALQKKYSDITSVYYLDEFEIYIKQRE